jgi:hypothetical protein
MPCRAHAIVRQCRVLREILVVAGNIRTASPTVLTGCNASHNNLRGTPRGNQKKPNAGRSSTCRLWTADSNLHIPCHAPCPCRAVPWPWELAFRMAWSWHATGTAWARQACVNRTRQYCVNQIGKTHTLSDKAWQGNCMGTAWYVWISLKISVLKPVCSKNTC